ncbi:MAG TPA: PEP-CTERM sorting domain-containing protein [Caldimonas sp.]|nr:PEP-CTERM sorting domain-containing protein [Caldimonas sp.]
MLQKCLPLLGALLLATPASAITINMSDFTFGAPADVSMTGTDGSPSYSGSAGEFTGAVADGLAAASSSLRLELAQAAAPTSFVAWCAELTQSFSFGIAYEYQQVSGDSYFGAAKATDLSRLFTAAQGFVVDRFTSAALQAGIWEIIYEHGPSFSLTGGTFKGAPEEAAGQNAFDIVNGFLMNLGAYKADARIDVLTNGEHQDFLIATIPEPETWMLFAMGLGAVGLLKRRRRA